jgi:hypothetical protein
VGAIPRGYAAANDKPPFVPFPRRRDTPAGNTHFSFSMFAFQASGNPRLGSFRHSFSAWLADKNKAATEALEALEAQEGYPNADVLVFKVSYYQEASGGNVTTARGCTPPLEF